MEDWFSFCGRDRISFPNLFALIRIISVKNKVKKMVEMAQEWWKIVSHRSSQQPLLGYGKNGTKLRPGGVQCQSCLQTLKLNVRNSFHCPWLACWPSKDHRTCSCSSPQVHVFSLIIFALVANFQPTDLEHLWHFEVTGSPKDFTAETWQSVETPTFSMTRTPFPEHLHGSGTECQFLICFSFDPPDNPAR